MPVTSVTLNNGLEMPIVGLGTSNHKSIGNIRIAVEAAIDEGYRLFDCAYAYKNECEVGEALQNKIKHGSIKRKELFVTTKLHPSHFRRVSECLNKSLKSLKLDYVDLYLIHFPTGIQYKNDEDLFPKDQDGKLLIDEDIHYAEVWKEMEKLQKAGLTRAIGISNFNEYQINKLLETATIPPAVHQYERHPYLNQKSLFELCKKKGIAVTAYCPLGSPGKKEPTQQEPVLLEDAKLLEIAAKYNKTVAQILLRYQLDVGVIVIPKSTTPSRIKSNFQVFDFRLNDEDRQSIELLDRNWRIVYVGVLAGHKYYPFKEKYSEN